MVTQEVFAIIQRNRQVLDKLPPSLKETISFVSYNSILTLFLNSFFVNDILQVIYFSDTKTTIEQCFNKAISLV